MTTPSDDRRHPMKVVMRRTGLSADLLRVWERRYGAVKPLRAEGGRRLYSDEDIQRLRLLHAATLAGRSIGQVAGLPTEALAELARDDAAAERNLSIRPTRVPDALGRDVADEVVKRCLRAIEAMDAPRLELLLRRAVISLPVSVTLEKVVAGLLQRIGVLWREGTFRPSHEHLASAVVRRALDRIIEDVGPRRAAPTLAVATPTGQRHELGALLVAAAAALDGWRVVILGADLPAEEIYEAARRSRARGVAVSLVYPEGDAAVAHELRRLAALLPEGVELLTGGSASRSYRAVLEEIGAVALDDLTQLRSQLRAMRRPRRTRRSRAAL